jgi:hypothetical protein
MGKITVLWSSESFQIANDDDDDDDNNNNSNNNNNNSNIKLWSTFVIVLKKLVGPQFDKKHSAYGNTAHPLTIKTDPKYIYIISSYRAVNTLRLG